jgi:hypothetical protein
MQFLLHWITPLHTLYWRWQYPLPKRHNGTFGCHLSTTKICQLLFVIIVISLSVNSFIAGRRVYLRWHLLNAPSTLMLSGNRGAKKNVSITLLNCPFDEKWVTEATNGSDGVKDEPNLMPYDSFVDAVIDWWPINYCGKLAASRWVSNIEQSLTEFRRFTFFYTILGQFVAYCKKMSECVAGPPMKKSTHSSLIVCC